MKKKIINEFSIGLGYKISTQRSVVFLYSNNKVPEREIKKRVPLVNASKRLKNLRKNLTKKVKNLYYENPLRH